MDEIRDITEEQAAELKAQGISSVLLQQLIAIVIEKMLPLIIERLKEYLGIGEKANGEVAPQGLVKDLSERIAGLLSAEAQEKMDEILARVQEHDTRLINHAAQLDLAKQMLELMTGALDDETSKEPS